MDVFSQGGYLGENFLLGWMECIFLITIVY